VPSGNVFAKRYELHYQSKIVKTLEGDQIAQYGCLNFHAKRDGSPKLSLLIENKWLWDGQNRGFIAECHVGGAPKVAKACMRCIRG
jgi:hypothetical protein